MRIRLKGVYQHRKKLRNGDVRYYYTLRRVGPLKPLRGDEGEPFYPGSAAFMRAYQAANEAPLKARIAGTLQSIINAYLRSPQFGQKAPRTKLDYNSAVIKIEAKWGAYPLDVIDDPKIRLRFLEWRDELALSTPRQADAILGVLRIILEFGRDRGMLAFNHATRPKKVYRADRSDKLWLPHHIAAFREVASAEMRLALELALWTGQRQGDLLRLCWSSYDGKRITLRQGKRHRKVDMPVASPLRILLDQTPRRALTILTAPNGKPWRSTPKATHFQHLWREATLAAGLDGLHFHDLRGTTCTLLAEAGATPSEIAAMLGWTVSTVNRMLDTYQAMTASLSDSAVAKLERNDEKVRNEVRNG
jgi:integrase